MSHAEFLPKISRRNLMRSGALIAAGIAVGGCGSGSNGSSATPSILRVRQTLDPSTLDPARENSELNLLAYATLIRRAPDGSLQAGLAASWQYIGDDNTTFEITLRPDLIFSDETPLDAEAVRENINYYRDPDVASPAQQHLSAVTKVEVIDDLTVRLELSQPHPLMPLAFSDTFWAGQMISPAALARPEMLTTGTYGAGPYVLEPDETVHGDHFTYVPNPNYSDSSEVHWDKIVVHIMPEESSALAALESGQLDAGIVSYSMAEPGINAGLHAIGPGAPILLGLSLWDRAGDVTPALGDLRVRQALNYAVDRDSITTGLIGEFGIPTDQLSSPQHDGWNENGYYTYDPQKAAELLAEAGYADGFTLPVRTDSSEFLVRIVEAIADNLGDIGVELDIIAVRNYDQADGGANRDFAAGLMGWGIEPAYLMGRSFWLPDSPNNPFASVDERLIELDEQAAVADQDSLGDIEGKIIARVAELAWFLPVVLFGNVVLHTNDIEIPWHEGQTLPPIYTYQPAT